MTIETLGRTIETLDNQKVIDCFVVGGRLIATFATRKDVEVEVLTPFEKRLVERGKFTQDDIISKIFELKSIANA